LFRPRQLTERDHNALNNPVKKAAPIRANINMKGYRVHGDHLFLLGLFES
jgi:hypothetical protein